MKNKVIVSMLAITLAAGISIGATNALMSVTHTSIENPVSNASAPLVTEISLEETAVSEETAETAVKEAAETAVEEAAVEKAGSEKGRERSLECHQSYRQCRTCVKIIDQSNIWFFTE